MQDNITAFPESQASPHNPVSDTNQIDIRYMTLALQEANKAMQEGEIPVGCPYYDRCAHKLEKCDKIRPDLIPIDDNKRVRCFKYEE